MNRLRGQPPVFCNSIQKAGTHLQVGLAASLPGLDNTNRGAYWNYASRARVPGRDGEDLQRVAVIALRRIACGETIRGHLAHHQEFSSVIAARRVRHLLIVRDPRDILVSLFHWWSRGEDSQCWAAQEFRKMPDDESRYRLLVEGWPDAPPAGVGVSLVYPDIGQRLREYAGWFDDPGCLITRYEDLVGPEFEREYERISRHLLPDANPAITLPLMCKGSDPARSKTFRKGGAGSWRTELPPALAARASELAADYLSRFRYESG